MIARAPASSANLGPGFDALGLALALHAEVGALDDGAAGAPPGATVAEPTHPAAVAHRRAGGSGRVWVRCPIPSGRGLGFSGAVRAAGALLALAQLEGPEAAQGGRRRLLPLLAELEGHADNVAASILGGAVATAGGRAVRIPLGCSPAVVVAVPPFETSTAASRRLLGAGVGFDDAVFNVGRTALLVAALAAGDVDALRDATQDRLHQERRLDAAPPSRAALEAALDHGAWCAWLSGSGPTVAALCEPDQAGSLAARMASAMSAVTGDRRLTTPEQRPVRSLVLPIDGGGATVGPGGEA